MKRIPEGWFEFKGIRSDAMGIRLQSMPERTIPGRKVQRKPVSGRNGSVAYGDTSFEDASASILCDVRDSGADISQIIAWLTGEGSLRFSDEPELVYAASIEQEYARSSISALMTGQRFRLKWTCEPFRKLTIAADPITFYTSGDPIINPGTATSLPRVEIIGNGDFRLNIGAESIAFFGIEGGIVVDSELMDALSLDGKELLNNKISGTPFEIQPGLNTVSWILEEGANIESVTITPRWRYI